MISFGPLKDKQFSNKRRMLTEDLLVYEGSHLLYAIQAGTISDGMSFPWWVRWKWDCLSPRYRAAAYFHDDLLVTSDKEKKEIDWLFMGALIGLGVPSLEVALFWLAVRTKRHR